MSRFYLPRIWICCPFERGGGGGSSQTRPAAARHWHRPVQLWGVWGGRLSAGPYLGASCRRAVPSPLPQTRHLLFQAVDHLSTGGPGWVQDFSSLLLLSGETNSHLHLDQPRSIPLPFKVRSSCLASGKCHKGFCFPWLTSRKCSLIIDPLALI